MIMTTITKMTTKWPGHDYDDKDHKDSDNKMTKVKTDHFISSCFV